MDHIRLSPQAAKYIKKSSPHLKMKIVEEILKIDTNYFLGKRLKGKKFHHLRCHGFSYKGVQYRIAYETEEGLFITAVSTRENFYKEVTIFI